MGVGFLYAIVIFILLLLVFTGLLLLFIKRKLKVGIVISSIFIVFFLAVLFTNYLDQWTITKNDVKNDLTYFDVKLNDDFKIENNKVSGMPERYQETRLIISEDDTKRIVNQIKSAKNFKVIEISEDGSIIPLEMDGEIHNLKYPNFYSRELYKNYKNNISANFQLMIGEKNKLRYSIFED